MSNGHAWSDIKQYTLSEIGVFMRSIYSKMESDRMDKFSLSWMSSNLTQEGMEKVLESMKKESKTVDKEVKTKEEVANEWKRLAAAFK